MYIKKYCKIRDTIEVHHYYPGNYGAPGIKREAKLKKTPEQIAKQNAWKRKKYLTRLLKLNFEEGDWHAVLRVDKQNTMTPKEAKKTIRKYIKDVRREFKKYGWILKYVFAEEWGIKKKVHWHLVINHKQNDITSTVRTLRKIWKIGKINFSPLWPDYDYEGLADYMLKESEKKINEGLTDEKLCYTPSRNLIKPEEKKKEIKANKWRKEPAASKGYEVIKQSIINGESKFTGYPYQYYIMKKISRKGVGG